jgi:hypothetical protein
VTRIRASDESVNKGLPHESRSPHRLNEIIARLELTDHNAREAWAIRAQLWLSQEADLERLEEVNEQEAQGLAVLRDDPGSE